MEYLEELCKDLNLAPPQKSEKGAFTLPLDSSLKIGIRPLDRGVAFNSPIAPCPEIKKEELLIQLMKANLFGQGTLGAIIGLDDKENLLTLSLHLPYDMNYRSFRERLEDFANIVDYWREEVAQHVEKAQRGIL